MRDFETVNQGRAETAKKIRKALRTGPSGTLLGASPMAKLLGTDRVRKGKYRGLSKGLVQSVADGVREAFERVGIMKPDSKINPLNGIGDCSTFRKIHAKGPQVDTAEKEYLRKVGMPPQSWNAQWDNNRADDGAHLDVVPQQFSAPKRTRLGPTHAESISDREPLPESSNNEDPTVSALKQIYAKGPNRGL